MPPCFTWLPPSEVAPHPATTTSESLKSPAFFLQQQKLQIDIIVFLENTQLYNFHTLPCKADRGYSATKVSKVYVLKQPDNCDVVLVWIWRVVPWMWFGSSFDPGTTLYQVHPCIPTPHLWEVASELVVLSWSPMWTQTLWPLVMQ